MEEKMISLRNFMDEDAIEFQQKRNVNMSINEIKDLFAKWQEKEFEGKYFEMFSVVKDNEIVGMISLYKHSESVISCGPEIFECYRKQGIAEEAMILAMDIAKTKGYKLVSQQIRLDNTASVSLHKKLGFETDGFDLVEAYPFKHNENHAYHGPLSMYKKVGFKLCGPIEGCIVCRKIL